MKPNKRPDCNCINCDRSCYKAGDSGVRHRHTTKEVAKKRLADLKQMVAGGAS
jgi:hypothetical protein